MKSLILACALPALAQAAAATDVSWERLTANGPAVNLFLRGRAASPVPDATPAPVVDAAAAPAACYERAKRELLELTPFAIAELCGGASSASAPIDCYAQAKSATDLTPIGRVNLCGGAPSAQAPIGCYRKARSELPELGGFARVLLCAASATVDGPLECYRDSGKHSDLPVFGRVKLCARRPAR